VLLRRQYGASQGLSAGGQPRVKVCAFRFRFLTGPGTPRGISRPRFMREAYDARGAAGAISGGPCGRSAQDRRRRPQRWRDAVAELVELQGDYQAWLDALPPSLADSATADALRAICDLDLSELQGIEPPRGFGRDRPGVDAPTKRRQRQRYR